MMKKTGCNVTKCKKQIANFWHEYQWTFIGLLAMVALLSGLSGFSQYYSTVDKAVSSWDVFYHSLRLFTLESAGITGELPWQLQMARFLAPIVIIYTAVHALLVIFRDQLNTFRLRRTQDHIIICGLGEKGYKLATGFIERGDKVVGIEQDIDDSKIDLCRELGVLVITGDAADRDRLKRAGIIRASTLFSVCGDDGVNAMVGSYARASATKRKSGRLTAHVHISDPEFSELLRGEELSMLYNEHFSLEFFNIYERAAHALLASYPAFPSSSEIRIQSSQIIIVGLGLFGTSLLLALARLWKVTYEPRGLRLKLFLVDTEVEYRIGELMSRYPLLRVFDDIFVFESDSNAHELDQKLTQIGVDETVIRRAYICHEDEQRSLSVALRLKRDLSKHNIPFVACTSQQSGLGLQISDDMDGKDSNRRIASFGLIDNACSPELLMGGLYELLARDIHNNYVHGELAKGITVEVNPVLVSWDELLGTLKASNRDQALHIGIKLQAVNCSVGPVGGWIKELVQFSKDEIEVMAKLEHERWVIERNADGWKFSEGDKNIEKKTSPHLIDWNLLEENIKDYDRDAVRNIPLIVAKVGFEVYRLDEK